MQTGAIMEIYRHCRRLAHTTIWHDVMLAIAGHAHTPKQLLVHIVTTAMFAGDSDRDIRQAAKTNINYSGRVLDITVEEYVCTRTDDPDVLHTLTATTTDMVTLVNAAGNPGCPHDVLEALAWGAMGAISSYAAPLARGPAAVAAAVIAAVAGNHNTTPEVLADIAGLHEHRLEVIQQLATNPHTPSKALIELASRCRISLPQVADHPNVTEDLLDTFIDMYKRFGGPVPESLLAWDIARRNLLNRYVDTLTGHTREHARLLIDSGFPGRTAQLDAVLAATVTTTSARHPVLSMSTRDTSQGHHR